MSSNGVTTYSAIYHEGRPLQVERITDASEMVVLAPAIADLLARAYGSQYEGPEGGIAAGAFARDLDYTVPGQRHRVHIDIRDILDAGGALYVVRSEDPNTLDGLLSVCPISPSAGEIAIREMAAHPPRQGIGSVLLHAALCDYSPEGRARLHAPVVGWVGDWYARLGFKNTYIPTAPLLVGDQRLYMERYELLEDVALSGVIQALEARLPGLASCKKSTRKEAGDYLVLMGLHQKTS